MAYCAGTLNACHCRSDSENVEWKHKHESNRTYSCWFITGLFSFCFGLCSVPKKNKSSRRSHIPHIVRPATFGYRGINTEKHDTKWQSNKPHWLHLYLYIRLGHVPNRFVCFVQLRIMYRDYAFTHNRAMVTIHNECLFASFRNILLARFNADEL